MIESTVTPAANRAEVIERIRAVYPDIQARFGVTRLAIFGSASRDELGEGSDVDVLATYAEGPTYKQFIRLKFLLEDTLGRTVDLATPDMLKDGMRSRIEDALLDVA